MAPDDDVPPTHDFVFPPVEPAADELLGWTPEPAMPEPAMPEPVMPAAFLPTEASPGSVEPDLREPETHEPVLHTEPVQWQAEPVEEPPSAGVLPVPRRSPAGGGPVSPVRALAGAAVAVAGVLLGIGALLWATDAPKGSPTLQQTQAQSSQISPTPEPSPSPEAVAATPAPLLTHAVVAPSPASAPKLALTVLNNSNVDKLAARASVKFHAAGWPIRDTGVFRGRIPVTTVYYAPGQQASAVLLQKQFPAIARVRPRFAALPGSGLTVVLTRDYPA